MQVVHLLVAWMINTISLFLLPYLMPSIQFDSFVTALTSALMLGLVNAVIRPVLALISLPITILTMGLFTFVLNGLLFWLVSHVIPGFQVAGFWSAVGGAFLYSVIAWSLSILLLQKK